MQTILLVFQFIIAIMLIIAVLLQKNSSDNFGGIGSSASFNNYMSGRSFANFLSKATVILATLFIINSLLLANVSGRHTQSSILDGVEISKEKKDEANEKNQVPIAK